LYAYISDSLADVSDLWTLDCCMYTAAFALLKSRGRLKLHHPDKRKEPQNDEVSLLRADLVCVSNELFRMSVNLKNCTRKEEK